jgi:DUF4097 and DUF4098 domain-containing protein YvlB
MLASSESLPTEAPVQELSNLPEVSRAVYDETERFEQSYPLNSNGRVSVSNINGSITVEAWDRKEVRLVAEKIADSKERLSEVQVRIDSRPDLFEVETDYDAWNKSQRGRNWGKHGNLVVNYKLSVPSNAVLDEIETINGSVQVSGTTNVTKISAVNGMVRAGNLRGAAKISTVNGTVEADFEKLERGSTISLGTVNGQVNLMLPSDSDATVKADTLNGNISNDFGLPVRKGQYVGRDLYGRLGSGDVKIKMDSVNGGLNIRRKNDGKPLSPAVNLLPAKDKDGDSDIDVDADDEDIAAAIEAKSVAARNKELGKAVAKAAKESVKAAKETAAVSSAEIAKAIKEAGVAVSAADLALTAVEVDARRLEVLARRRAALWDYENAYVGKDEGRFQVKGAPRVTIDAKDCAISIRGWDRGEVAYVVKKITRDRAGADNIKVEAEMKTADNVNIRVTKQLTNGRRGSYSGYNSEEARLEVFVPRGSNLKIIGGDEEIRIEGVLGEVDLAAQDGNVDIRDGEGMLKMSLADGKARVVGFRGAVDAKTADGTLSLEGDFTNLLASAADGTIILTLPENANADIESNCDNVEFEGFSLTKDDREARRWRLGRGGVKYQIKTADGETVIRNAAAIRGN